MQNNLTNNLTHNPICRTICSILSSSSILFTGILLSETVTASGLCRGNNSMGNYILDTNSTKYAAAKINTLTLGIRTIYLKTFTMTVRSSK